MTADFSVIDVIPHFHICGAQRILTYYRTRANQSFSVAIFYDSCEHYKTEPSSRLNIPHNSPFSLPRTIHPSP
ncbi:hypothetical protein HanXRQr2_Chr03g0090681 [Helianthus annuus]|uniref:Uncharacterized protein n=1 Tax=Helianthus annuus TaxID=4232 RepID=A0A251V3T2_HELAN|nr:hypothetical protein HanXRQr2_Chr03g0090681 [Helianthus annuus]KAJ0942017.1 hypothetical protein HanPSC8_Chr03g0086941 [Helianthus annuus]